MIVNQTTIKELAGKKMRIDGRKFTEYRTPITVETNISWTAEGSARVQLGETVVMAGVKLSLEKPYNDTPDQGGIMINAELTPLSSSEYESGPPGIKAIELSRVTDRGIREAKAIDMKQLCVVPGEKAWFVIIDIVTINDAGNLFDVAGLATLAALKAARFPVVDEETGAIDYKKKTDKPLPLTKEPLPVTVYKINGNLLVDPTAEEEKVYDARLTVATDEKGTISAMQKGGEAPLSTDEISQMMDMAQEKATFLRGVLDK
ncbi:exosome complex protein Rrp42 [Candidatus Woesearchaeota archaeon]|jgi:exosome complex component RRP42|nr:exosome complex protein Rrp42 [Candidatus Woesearchaeota archaeon]MBT5396701.1 exosome complex protein Rrp42 [Candidatus Woesearchaeota archaeon]MBT5924317.1 exosome complex protein Rrp42 [Candidatus Woesearchaeota archaeon]MBT6367512.1 exosome complex protein Rrp42 [Candidatus Woesearchaeota archaeon]MBT7763011.1 exosome complex protein Rrp42 [Candidatus Woesearchaeota archaeon]